MRIKCNTCMDYIVCYVYDTLYRENCPDYHYDFFLYQAKQEDHTPKYDNAIPIIDKDTEVPWE